MSMQQIRKSLEKAARHLTENPRVSLTQDKPAVAVLESGLRCRTNGPNGATLVSDMAAFLGGTDSAPSPGWLLRAALANCDATLIVMRAALLGIVLTQLEVTVGSESDDRGILGVSDSVPPGPLSIRVSIHLAAEGASEVQLRELVRWAEAHSPVNDAVRRAVPVITEVSIIKEAESE
jgi:uncharacterized OsmC-like protein